MTGMKEVGDYQVNVFPDPASEHITLNIPSSNLLQYEIHSATGHLVCAGTVLSGSTIVNVRDLPCGLYSVKCYGVGQGVWIARFIKE